MQPRESPTTPAPKKPFRLSIVTKFAIALLIAALALCAIKDIGPSSAEVRLDTGDYRIRWFGIPLEHQPMPEPARSKIIALAAMPPPIREEWVSFIPPSTLHNPHLQCVADYFRIAEWSDQDRALARLLLIDAADEARKTSYIGQVTPGYRDAHEILDFKSWHDDSFAGWKQDPEVLQYCAAHNYTLPP